MDVEGLDVQVRHGGILPAARAGAPAPFAQGAVIGPGVGATAVRDVALRDAARGLRRRAAGEVVVSTVVV
ncbi:hypothetical protein PL81_19055, partial [Streptomyces sp. RSD-27]